MTDRIIERILREAQAPDLIDVLADRLSLSDRQSVLLEVYRRRVKKLSPSGLLRQYEQNRFVRPAQVDPRELLEFELLAYSLLPSDFQVLELAPVCPLGTNSVVATVDQNRVLTTIRNTEVCADVTGVLALEAARHRRALYQQQGRPGEETKLCASHRVLRAQRFQGPASFPHFRILNLCTAGRDRGSYRFESTSLVEHIGYFIRLIETSRQAGFRAGALRVSVTAFDETRCDVLRAEVLEPLSAAHPETAIAFDRQRTSGRGYYVGAGFQIFCRDPSGTEFFLVDGGFTDWTQQLLSNRKERLLTSGMGSERFIFCFSQGGIT